MDEFATVIQIILLCLLLIFVLANFVGLWLLWVHIDRRGNDIRAIDRRVSTLEAAGSVSLKETEVRQIYERLADLDARVQAMDDRTVRIETYLMESGK